MVKVKETNREFKAKPNIMGMPRLEIIVSMTPVDRYSEIIRYGTGGVHKVYDAEIAYNKGEIRLLVEYMRLHTPALPKKIQAKGKNYLVKIGVIIGDQIDEEQLTEGTFLTRHLKAPYKRRVRKALYETLRAVAEQL